MNGNSAMKKCYSDAMQKDQNRQIKKKNRENDRS